MQEGPLEAVLRALTTLETSLALVRHCQGPTTCFAKPRTSNTACRTRGRYDHLCGQSQQARAHAAQVINAW